MVGVWIDGLSGEEVLLPVWNDEGGVDGVSRTEVWIVSLSTDRLGRGGPGRVVCALVIVISLVLVRSLAEVGML